MMKTSKRSLVVLAAAIVLGVILAVVVASSGGNGAVTGLGTYGSGEVAQTGVTADTSGTSATGAAVGLAVDPAKSQPVLDKFTRKNPFKPLTAPIVPSGGGNTQQQPTSANITVNGTASTVKVGDKVPTSSPVFSVSAITTSGVTFELLNGAQFTDGSTSVTVPPDGSAVKAQPTDGSKSYTLTVTKLNSGTGGGSSTTQGGHTISVTHIDSQNGVAVATIVVDGTTYADKKAGDVFSTSFGEIKIVSVDAAGQTVTILHGDVTLTLSAGQTVSK
jgi:hypothetical protein